MKMISIIVVSLMVSDNWNKANFTETDHVVYRGDMRIDRVLDPIQGVVCYVGQHSNGSSHTTPAISCLKSK